MVRFIIIEKGEIYYSRKFTTYRTTENAKKQKNKTTANIRIFHSDSNQIDYQRNRSLKWSAFRQLFHLEAAKQNSALHPLQLASQNRSLCLSETTLVALQLEMKHNNLGLWPNQSTKLHQKLVNFQKGESLAWSGSAEVNRPDAVAPSLYLYFDWL